MRIDVRIKRGKDHINTTLFKSLGESPPATEFHINTELVSSAPLKDSEVLVLSMSSAPFADGEVAVKLPPLPFFTEFEKLVRYQHTGERHPRSRRKPRPARNTPQLGITLSYLFKDILGSAFVAGQGPVYFGLSPAPEAVSSDRTQAAANVGAVDEGVRAAILEAVDAFVMRRFRPQRGARVTSRDIRYEFIEEEGHNFSEAELNDLRPIDITRRVRAIFGVTMEKTGTRIKGKHQRYWQDYTI